MSNIGFRIKADFERPDPKLIKAFAGIPIANISDCMNRLACMDTELFPMNEAPLAGTAFTVKSTGGDNLLFHKALEMAQPGDVLVIAGGGTMKRSYSGEVMATYAKARGLAGFVVDGCMRDIEEISQMDFPVYCKGITPNGPYKNGPGEINFPVSCAGQIVCPGDIVLGDQDGVIVIKPEEAAELAAEARAFCDNETRVLASIAAGNGMGDRSWIDKALQAKGCLYL